MDTGRRIEGALDAALARAEGTAEGAEAPPRLLSALRYAVFPGGARIRPKLCLAVAQACGEDDPAAVDAAAAAIELLHCASLVHDDLPCFDDADLRRGKPSVHRAYGEPLAVLAGDGLIVLAFETMALGTARHSLRLAPLVRIVAASVAAPHGIVAGQAWECEPQVPLALYQQAKTGALFAAATQAGAAATGHDAPAWRLLGERLGEAFQVADDIRDVVCTQAEIGKPIGQDASHHRPSAVSNLGVPGAMAHLDTLMTEAVASIPQCPGRDLLRQIIVAQTRKFLPKELASRHLAMEAA